MYSNHHPRREGREGSGELERRREKKYLFICTLPPFYHRIRGVIWYWMENNEFGKVKEWLGESRNELEGMFEAGEVPVVGWLELEKTMKNAEPRKRNLEAEMDENGRAREEVAAQIKILDLKQQKLEEEYKKLQQQMKGMEQIAMLKEEIQSIALLGKKEAAWVGKVEEKMKNEYFMEEFDSEDVSTVFSMFQMDMLFSRYKKNDVDNNNLGVTAGAVADHLQNALELEFSEAVELLWKLKLLENGEKGVGTHLKKCSICSSTKPGVLLREYGMKEEDTKKIEEKMNNWKGYYFSTVSAVSAASELKLDSSLRPKLTTCWKRIEKAHKWEHSDD